MVPSSAIDVISQPREPPALDGGCWGSRLFMFRFFANQSRRFSLLLLNSTEGARAPESNGGDRLHFDEESFLHQPVDDEQRVRRILSVGKHLREFA
jgi:hypothetical protein